MGPPFGAPIQELRPGQDQKEDGSVPHAPGEKLHQVERARICPVDVLEDERDRRFRGQCLDESPGGGEQDAPVRDSCLGAQPDHHGEAGGHLRREIRRQHRGDASSELLSCHGGGVRFENACERAELPPEGSEARALAIGERSPLQGPSAALGDVGRKLVGQPALADPRRSHNREEVGNLLAHDALPQRRQKGDLGAAPDHGRGRDGALPRSDDGLHGSGGQDWSILALDPQLLGGLVADGQAGRPIRFFPDKDAPAGCRRLEAGRGVDGIAHHREAAVRAHGGVHHLPGVDADPQGEGVDLLGVLPDVPLELERCPNGSFGVVVVGDGGAEQRHERVADHPADRTLEPLDDASHPHHALVDKATDVLGVHLA